MENEKEKIKCIENIVCGIILLGFIGFLYILNITYLDSGYKIVLKHVIYFLWAFIMFFLILTLPCKFLELVLKNMHLIYLVTLTLLLCGYLTPLGAKINNAVRWIKMGPLYLQPSEFLKYICVLFIWWIYKYTNMNLTYKTILSLCSIVISAILIGLAPDIGSMALIIVVCVIILVFLFPAKKNIILLLTALSLFCICVF